MFGSIPFLLWYWHLHFCSVNWCSKQDLPTPISPTMMYLKMYEYCEEDILEVGKLFEFCNRSSTNRSNIQTKEGNGNEEVQANTEELLGITRRWLIGGEGWTEAAFGYLLTQLNLRVWAGSLERRWHVFCTSRWMRRHNRVVA